MKLQKVIAQIKARQNVTSEEAVGKLIGVSGVTVMRWRKELNVPEPEHAQRLAELAGIDPAPFVAEMLARSTTDKNLIKTYKSFKSLATAALASLVSLSVCILCKIREQKIHFAHAMA